MLIKYMVENMPTGEEISNVLGHRRDQLTEELKEEKDGDGCVSLYAPARGREGPAVGRQVDPRGAKAVRRDSRCIGPKSILSGLDGSSVCPIEDPSTHYGAHGAADAAWQEADADQEELEMVGRVEQRRQRTGLKVEGGVDECIGDDHCARPYLHKEAQWPVKSKCRKPQLRVEGIYHGPARPSGRCRWKEAAVDAGGRRASVANETALCFIEEESEHSKHKRGEDRQKDKDRAR